MRIGELANAELFKGLSAEQLRALLERCAIRKVRRGECVFREGDVTRTVYLIASGRVRVYVTGDDGREVSLCMLRPGEHFGELSLLDGERHSASVVALDACSLVVIGKEDFLALLNNNPGKMMSLLQVLAKRIRQLTALTRNLALLDVYGRIVRLLLDGAIHENGQRIVKEKLTHQQIAELVGSSRTMVSRILKDLHDGGYIKTENGRLMIGDKLPPGW